MKKTIPFALLVGAFAIPSPGATTTPVGYVSLGDTQVGSPAVGANTEVAISIPLLKPVESVATVASAAGSTITINETLVAGEFDPPVSGAPFMVEIASGASEGLFAVVSSNDASTITVMLGGGDDLTGLTGGDTVRIREAWTLETLLPSASLPDGVQLAAFDVQPGIDNSANPLYLNNSGFGGWIDGATFSPAGSAVLYPGESFILINPTANPINDLVVSGEVPTSQSRLKLFNDTAGVPQDTRFGYVGPVGEILDDIGFAPTDGDQILVFDPKAPGLDKSASQILIFNPGFGGWIDGATFGPVGSTFEIEGGLGYVYRRAASAPVGTQTIQDQQSYLPLP